MVTLGDLLKVPSKDDLLDLLIAVLRLAGFPVASWQSGSVPRSLTEAEASNLADLAQTIAAIAAGGLLDYASGGWLDLLADSLFDERRKPAVFTRGTVRLTDAAGAGPFTITPGQLWVSEVGKAFRFSNLAGGTLPLGGTLDLLFQAESPGAAYNLAPGAIVDLLTSLPGVSVSNPGAWITQKGADEEKDDELKLRCRAKWATIGTGSTADAYTYYALSASPEVKRTRVIEDPNTGLVTVVLAAALGAVSQQAATLVNAFLQTKRPLTVKLLGVAATEHVIPVQGTVYVTPGTDLTQAVAAAQTAVDAYARTLGIGATVYRAALIEAMMGIAGAYNMTLAAPATDPALGAQEVFVPTYQITAQYA